MHIFDARMGAGFHESEKKGCQNPLQAQNLPKIPKKTSASGAPDGTLQYSPKPPHLDWFTPLMRQSWIRL
jgi:hypothetical protein